MQVESKFWNVIETYISNFDIRENGIERAVVWIMKKRKKKERKKRKREQRKKKTREKEEKKEKEKEEKKNNVLWIFFVICTNKVIYSNAKTGTGQCLNSRLVDSQRNDSLWNWLSAWLMEPNCRTGNAKNWSDLHEHSQYVQK